MSYRYSSISKTGNGKKRNEDSIKIANRYILELAASKKEGKGMATTTDVFFLNNNIIYWGHIGDSRIYDLKNGKLNQLTKDHSLVQQMVDGGFLSIKDA